MAPNRAPTRESELSIEVPGGAPARLVVVSDTHSRPHPGALERIRRQEPSRILHAGDVGRRSVLDDLEAIAPVAAVRGNVDGRGEGLPDLVTLDLVAAAGRLRLLLLHFGVYGARLRPEVLDLARRRGAGLVVCGHSHVPLVASDRGVAVFNPGSIGPRRSGLPITFGVLELGPEGLGLSHVDCESGGPWRPPTGPGPSSRG